MPVPLASTRSNQTPGDATGSGCRCRARLPTGVKYVEGIEAVDNVDSGLRWSLGTLDSGDVRNYRVALQLGRRWHWSNLSSAPRAAGDIASVGQTGTVIETLEDVDALNR